MEIVINYFAVLLAAVASYAVGAVWYSPIGFGKPWRKLMGLTAEDMRKMPLTAPQAMILGFLFTLVTAYVMEHLMVLVGVTMMPEALTLGFWLWLGFATPVLSYSWVYEGKSVKLFFLNAAHLFIALEVMAFVLGLWH